MQKIVKIICIISILSLFISLYFYKRGRKFLNINNENRKQVYEYLNDYIWSNDKKYYSYYYISNKKTIKKIAYGRDWNEGCIFVYYSTIAIKPEKLIIYEGETKKAELSRYIEANGYNESNIWKWVSIIFIIIICFCIIKLLILKR